MTNTTLTTITAGQATTTALPTQKVVVVNGSSDMTTLLETVLDAGHYDIVFVESSDRAYSHIKRVQPNLIILCMQLEDPEGFQVLSMLKLDDETRSIPVLTHTTGFEEHEPEDDLAEASDLEMFTAAKAALSMN